MNYYFEKCIVIGTGQFAFNCAKYLYDRYQLDHVYEYGSYAQSRLEVLCGKGNIPYVKLYNKTQCNELMLEIQRSGKRTLIVSASNIYIFPEFIVENVNIKIINYHPGLISKHLGRNAEAWAIYGQDSEAGVTWHEVTSKIDHGGILAEDVIKLNENITAINLMIKQYQIGFELYKEFIGCLIENEEIPKKEVAHYGVMHYSYEKPNNGILDISWKQNKISAFLRSMDYGKLNILGKPCIKERESIYCWDSYQIIDDEKKIPFTDSKIIKKENIIFALQGYHMVVKGEEK